MKKLFVPRGDTVHYESLYTENLVVKGCLEVDGAIHARHISGDGVILAGSISADTIVADELESGTVTAEKITAHRITASEVQGGAVLVTGYLASERVKAGKLTVTLSDIAVVDAEEVINLTGRKHSLLGTLLRSWLRSKWMSLRRCKTEAEANEEQESPTPASGDLDHAEGKTSVTVIGNGVEKQWDPRDEEDFEFRRLCGLYSILKPQGYALRLVPLDREAQKPAA